MEFGKPTVLFSSFIYVFICLLEGKSFENWIRAVNSRCKSTFQSCIMVKVAPNIKSDGNSYIYDKYRNKSLIPQSISQLQKNKCRTQIPEKKIIFNLLQV